MELTLVRRTFTKKSTIGDLYIDGVKECFTLEDVVRDKKIKGETAIPYGKYRLIISYSPRFKKNLPLLVNVPDFDGVRIHSGNKPADTEGCILVGNTEDKDFVGNSRVTFTALYSKIKRAFEKEDVYIEIMK